MIGRTGTGANGVCLLGEAWGKAEKKRQLPFQGPAGAQLAKMLKLLGYERDEFLITNCFWDQPPGNRDPTPEELEAHRSKWEALVHEHHIKVLVPLGNIALWTALGQDGIQGKRGYVWWHDRFKVWVVPTVHPSFILRGNANWTAVWLHDIQRAVGIAAHGPPAAPERELTLDPQPLVAQGWAEVWKHYGQPPLAFDIETADKGGEDDTVEINLGQAPGKIYRIGFAYRAAGRTLGLSIPWGLPFDAVLRVLLGLSAVRVVWNRHFDVPRVRAHGFSLDGPLHDAQEAWHLLCSDLPKKLEFVAPILVPGQPYWKDQNWEQPAWYNCLDACVTVEAFEKLYG